MTIVLTGGGSGGHITPVLAVADALKQIDSRTTIIYVGQKGDSLGDIPLKDPNIDRVYTVRAGKFRRFHGEGLRQLLDLKVLFLNVRDLFYVVIGTFQSWRLMRRLNPDIVFSRGGFVSVPVTIGAKLNGIPYITHDSDSIPSLANRLIARWARLHAVALDEKLYPYPREKTVKTGIPLNKHFKPINAELQNKYRSQINIPKEAKMLFVIGGGLGSQDINHAVADIVPHLLNDYKDLYIVHAAGRINEEELRERYKETISDTNQKRLQVFPFLEDVYLYSGAADIVITRAGATNLAEFEVQGKACIIIPSSFLAGGHQLKNANYLEEQGAALVLDMDDLVADPNRLAKSIISLLNDEQKRSALSKKFKQLGQPDAAHTIARLILEQV